MEIEDEVGQGRRIDGGRLENRLEQEDLRIGTESAGKRMDKGLENCKGRIGEQAGEGILDKEEEKY